MKLDFGRQHRLLDLRDKCYVDEKLNSEKIKSFYDKIEEYRNEGYKVEVYEMVVGIMISHLGNNSLETLAKRG